MYSYIILMCIVSTNAYYAGYPTVMKKTASYWERYARRQGPNTCVQETLPNKGVSYDRAWTGGKYCGVNTIIKFECCDGYEAVRGTSGCIFVKPILPAYDVSEVSGGGSFIRLQETARLWTHLSNNKQSAVTLLVPLDRSINSIPQHTISHVNYSTRFQEAPSLLSYHVLQGRIALKDLPTDSTAMTLYNEQTVRFNTFSNGLVTVNCIPIVRGDIKSSQGTVHVIESVLNTNYIYSITDSILRNVHMRRLANYIVQGRFESLLRSEGPFTLLAPSDEAFNRLPHQHVHDILYDEAALKALINNHVVQEVQCSPVLQNATIRNRNGVTLRSRCTSAGTVIGGAKIELGDEMALNGVIHMVDRVILPKRAKYIIDLLHDLGLTTVATLVKNSGLESVFSGGSAFTLFAPTNTAFQSLSKYEMNNILYRNTEAQLLLTNHMAVGKYLMKDVLDKQQIRSKGTRQDFRIRFFRSGVMVDNAVINTPDIEGLNGVIHVVNTVLTPNKQTITQYLNSRGNFTRFLNALRRTSPSLIHLLDSSEGPFTVFAVSDEYIDHWATDLFTYHRMLSDVRVLNEILRNHIVPGTYFTSSFEDNVYSRVTSKSVDPLLIRKISATQIYAGDSLILNKDNVCTNGVIHAVNRLIQVPNPTI